MRKIKVAATQMVCVDDVQKNIATAEKLVRDRRPEHYQKLMTMDGL